MTAPLDPLIQLSVAMAVTPGGYAVLLGSGVSMEAGIPTGQRVFLDTVERLYRVQEGSDPPNPEELKDWVASEGLDDLGYSGLLERVLPTEQGRRDYLVSFFKDRSPGATHLALAELAREGMVGVFITTNFDPLLERALEAAGVQVVMVSDAESLERAPARETVDCFVIKAHGDAGQVNVRNTLGEIAELEPRMQEELEEVCARHGVLTLGYSGNDLAVGKALRKTSSRFGLYWGARRPELSEAAKATVSAATGKVVVRAGGAKELVEELSRRVASWAEHSTGQTPTSVRAEMIERLRSQDAVGVRELAKSERQHFEEGSIELIEAAYEEFGPDVPDPSQLGQLETDLAALFERKLAIGLALIEHQGPFVEEAEWLAMFSVRDLPLRDGSLTAWVQAPRRLAWQLVWVYAGFACAARRFSALKVLWEAQQPTAEADPVAALDQAGGREFGAWLEIARNQKWMGADGLWYLAFLLSGSEMIRNSYPELVRSLGSHDGVLSVLSHFGDAAYFLAALGGRDQVPVTEYWEAGQVGLNLVLRMSMDKRLRAELSWLFDADADLEERVVEQIVEWKNKNPGGPPRA
jgi:hypothetical protein